MYTYLVGKNITFVINLGIGHAGRIEFAHFPHFTGTFRNVALKLHENNLQRGQATTPVL